MTDVDLSKYEVTFEQSAIGGWEWNATGPDGARLSAYGIFMSKERAERDALRRIKAHRQKETLNGQDLQTRVGPS